MQCNLKINNTGAASPLKPIVKFKKLSPAQITKLAGKVTILASESENYNYNSKAYDVVLDITINNGSDIIPAFNVKLFT